MSGLGLDYIREEDDYYAIGAMATQGDVERFAPFQTYAKGLLVKAVHPILGVQFRNMATMEDPWRHASVFRIFYPLYWL